MIIDLYVAYFIFIFNVRMSCIKVITLIRYEVGVVSSFVFIMSVIFKFLIFYYILNIIITFIPLF